MRFLEMCNTVLSQFSFEDERIWFTQLNVTTGDQMDTGNTSRHEVTG
jgi:hypothetical protein